MDDKIDSRRVVLIFIITIIIILLLGLLFYNNIKKSITIEACVKYVGDDYIIVIDKENDEEYLLENNDKYNVGDEVSFILDDINDNVSPKEARIIGANIVSRNISFTISDSVSDSAMDWKNSNTDNSSNNNGGTVDSNNEQSSNQVGNDLDVIEYFSNINDSIDNYNNDVSVGNKIKEGFVNIVDFLFYEKEISGKTFKDLSTGAKLKVLKMALNIDSKIDSKFPGYKDSLTDKYKSVKEKVVEKYLDITADVCSKNENTCNSAKEGLGEMKNDFGITWSIIKNIAGVGVSKLKTWYEVWRTI